MFFPFQLALPKAAYFCFANTTAIFFPYCLLLVASFCLLHFAIWAYCSLFLGSLLVFLFSVVSFAVFLGRYSLFFNICLFQQLFSYLFYIVFCPLPLSFAFWTFRPLPFEISPVVFLLSVVSFAVFWGQYSLFFNVCLFQQRFFSLFVYCFFPLPFFPLLFGHFALCPFQFYKQSFARCPLLPLFVFCVWDSPFALLLTAICCKNLLLDKKFSKNKKSLEIVIKTFDNT